MMIKGRKKLGFLSAEAGEHLDNSSNYIDERSR
jgi:hypothetical protein